MPQKFIVVMLFLMSALSGAASIKLCEPFYTYQEDGNKKTVAKAHIWSTAALAVCLLVGLTVCIVAIPQNDDLMTFAGAVIPAFCIAVNLLLRRPVRAVLRELAEENNKNEEDTLNEQG